MNFVDTIGFRVFSDDLSKIAINAGESRVVNTISPNSYGISTKDEVFRQALKNTDYLVLDGVYFALASILMNGKNIKANQGPDVFYHFMERANNEHAKVFFLGSSEATLGSMMARTKRAYQGITAASYSPPFKPEFSREDNAMMVQNINEFSPDILFVGMTCPKQEKWAIEHKELLDAGLIVSIGNVFDWFAGTQKVIHPFWFKVKLGWLVRIFQRPEIFRRNIKNQMIFFWHTVLFVLKLKKYD